MGVFLHTAQPSPSQSRAMSGYEIESIRGLLPSRAQIDGSQALVADAAATVPVFIVPAVLPGDQLDSRVFIIHHGALLDTGDTLLTTVEEAVAWLAGEGK